MKSYYVCCSYALSNAQVTKGVIGRSFTRFFKTRKEAEQFATTTDRAVVGVGRF
jgi:hypothetical protein